MCSGSLERLGPAYLCSTIRAIVVGLLHAWNEQWHPKQGPKDESRNGPLQCRFRRLLVATFFVPPLGQNVISTDLVPRCGRTASNELLWVEAAALMMRQWGVVEPLLSNNEEFGNSGNTAATLLVVKDACGFC